jgi:hypothetical protein
MMQQAQHFDELYSYLPDVQFKVFGHGLIAAIAAKHEAQEVELRQIMERRPAPNHRVSFIHSWTAEAASYRYRAQIPAREMGVLMNDKTADVLIFAKPQAQELIDMGRAKIRGAKVIVDFCDDHFDWMYYQEAYRLADAITCPTKEMASRLKKYRGREAMVIPDPYEYPEVPPHCNGTNLLWFGHKSNFHTLERILPELTSYRLRVVSNQPGAYPWSPAVMLREFKKADIVILPATDTYKSANRAVEAIRQGCFVVAEPHPALEGIPGIWIGNIKEGIEWVQQHCSEASRRSLEAQRMIRDAFMPKIVSAMWKSCIQSLITWDLDAPTGTDGSMSISTTAPISLPMSAISQ